MGRPEADIHWKTVEDLLVSGCSGADIAGYLGMEPNTIYRRCEKDHGIPFSQYSRQFYAKGDSLLRAHQFAKALGKTNEGDNTLLIWLGKTRLKQKEEQSENVMDLNRVEAMMKQIDRLQQVFSSESLDESSPETKP